MAYDGTRLNGWGEGGQAEVHSNRLTRPQLSGEDGRDATFADVYGPARNGCGNTRFQDYNIYGSSEREALKSAGSYIFVRCRRPSNPYPKTHRHEPQGKFRLGDADAVA
jgi:hypothetical protein